MTSATPPVDEMHYERLAQDALRGVIRAALARAAEPDGLPGAHHFYITFQTRAKGVQLPPDVVAKYPEEMTVVLQHQYEDLVVEDDQFSVMLRFGGVPKAMTVPYRAINRFFDPSVQFLLQFETVAAPDPDEDGDEEEAVEAPVAEVPADDGPKVVSLDQFRKK
ncbi:ClpXP protease specificity-enhancing factor SspB [Brevundimonas sp. A19_0]|uniref:SspB family protein n=1 Tax=Brevundimonas sp. A19_0 TaxID=2821087 RepID=UPI001ADABE6C|nr:ClpXP protease specificity-enhancing factor SspB [Brevundimonas sp. A19_0]MBO9500603.1 stringent starvation protein B [Brevundimonas sp. A19_0]